MTRLNLKRRDIILIAGFWLIGCALLGVVFYYVLYQPTPPAPDEFFAPQATYTLVYADNTAKSQKPLADGQINLWQDDAKLYSVSATWERTELNQVGQAIPWTYRFYSPGQKRLYFVTAQPNGEVIGTSHGERVYNPPQAIPLEEWQVDSPEALNLWLNHGGAAMAAAIPGLQVIAQLQISAPNEPLTWTVVGFDALSNHYHTVFINAKTAEIMDITSSLASSN